jgi:adenylylsulfate kinase-like enzyme
VENELENEEESSHGLVYGTIWTFGLGASGKSQIAQGNWCPG